MNQTNDEGATSPEKKKFFFYLFIKKNKYFKEIGCFLLK